MWRFLDENYCPIKRNTTWGHSIINDLILAFMIHTLFGNKKAATDFQRNLERSLKSITRDFDPHW